LKITLMKTIDYLSNRVWWDSKVEMVRSSTRRMNLTGSLNNKLINVLVF
jgi:hypothetical protein